MSHLMLLRLFYSNLTYIFHFVAAYMQQIAHEQVKQLPTKRFYESRQMLDETLEIFIKASSLLM